MAQPGARILVSDAVVSDDPRKAARFQEMERWRDPSTVEFRTLEYLRCLFPDAGLPAPSVEHFLVRYLAHELIARAFPAGDDRSGLLDLIEQSVSGDLLGMNARHTSDGVEIAYSCVVLTAIKP